MPPRRTRGVRKSYAENPGVDDDDTEPVAVPDNDSDDDDFNEQAAKGAHDQGGKDDGDDEDEDDDDDDDDDDAHPSSEDEAIVGSTSSAPKRIRNTGAGMTQSRKNYHEIPSYPLETRIVTRVYAGPLRRYARYSALRDSMYGPAYHSIRIIWDMEKRWMSFSVFPPGYPPSHPRGVVPTPWVAPTFDSDQEARALRWSEEFQTREPENQRIRGIPIKHGQRLVPQAEGDILLLSGPFDEQKQYQLSPGTGMPLSSSGLGIEDAEVGDNKTMARGWVLDVGAIPVQMAWAPSARQDVQVLAVATIPFSDQEKPQPKPKGDGEKEKDTTPGAIQFWEFTPDPTSPGLAMPSNDKPVHVLTRCFDWGRPRRIQWCPVALESDNRYGMLAVLCGDGIARVIDVRRISDKSSTPTYEWMESSLTELGITTDYHIQVTCLAWANLNRIVLGHSDGSVTLWSIYPCQMLDRVAVHTSYIIDIATGYPSNPYIIATVPVGGCATITDLSQPTSESTYFPVPSINFQPNVLAWSEPMQGFLMLYPSSTPNTTVAFLHHRFFPQARSICTGTNSVTCIALGSTHPFLLMGAADGTVYSCNALQKLFKQKSEPLNKIKLLEHEYRPVEGWNTTNKAANTTEEGPFIRGAARILQGFLPEINDDPRTEKRKELDRKKKMERAKKASGGRGRKKGATAANSLAELDDRLASRMVIHEPLSRVTYLAWNPNLMFSCWAACSMGSGLIRVVDVGIRE
ncbi:WD40-repeat-containing domain protein [Rhypophila decipiens]|uniref:WD40-repeat-containing domain protein n=1 Tax=Rhypophila decipiens TaxID=261697 RepID=A0AAN6YEW4_9PEZI|nr:WD40-repeat-containing domain protein [Rhypophila decipiens]